MREGVREASVLRGIGVSGARVERAVLSVARERGGINRAARIVPRKAIGIRGRDVAQQVRDLI